MLHSCELRRQAAQRLGKADYAPRQLILLHTGVSLGASLLLAVLNFLFTGAIEDTGGLGGMGTRALLETAQAGLELTVSVLLPFWNIGLIRVALNWTREESARPTTLLEGFRRFGAVLGMQVMTAILFFAVGMAVINVGGMLFMLSPWSDDLTEALAPVMGASAAEAEKLLTAETIAQIADAAVPMLLFVGVLFAAVAIPVWYRIRFAEFAVMDGNRPLISLLESTRITRGKVWQVVKLDLSFWWFYLLQTLTVLLCYVGPLLQLAQVDLPLSDDGAYFLFFTLGILCQGVLLWFCQAKVSVTYGLAYEALRAPEGQGANCSGDL